MWPLWKTACPTFNNENHGNQHFPFCPAHQKHKDAADAPSPHGDLLSPLASPALCAPWPVFLFILLLPFLTQALDQASGRQEATEEVRVAREKAGASAENARTRSSCEQSDLGLATLSGQPEGQCLCQANSCPRANLTGPHVASRSRGGIGQCPAPSHPGHPRPPARLRDPPWVSVGGEHGSRSHGRSGGMDGQGPSQMAEVRRDLSGPRVGRQPEKTTAAQADLCSASPVCFSLAAGAPQILEGWASPFPKL